MVSNVKHTSNILNMSSSLKTLIACEEDFCVVKQEYCTLTIIVQDTTETIGLLQATIPNKQTTGARL